MSRSTSEFFKTHQINPNEFLVGEAAAGRRPALR